MPIILPSMFPAQVEIARDPHRFKVLAAGRRFGKTVLGVLMCFLGALTGFDPVKPRQGHCYWICQSFASASFQAGWQLAATIQAQVPGCSIHRQSKTFRFLNGGWFAFRSAEEPDSLRGESLDMAVIDEAAHIPKLKEIWELCLRPTLADRKGKALFISTPRGFNFFQQLWAQTGDPEWASFQRTSKDRPTFDQSEYDAMARSLPNLVKRQELDAEFVQLAGALFKREHFHIITSKPDLISEVRFWDLAFTTKTTSDFTAGVKVGLTSNGDLVISDLQHGQWEWPVALRIAKETALADGPNVIQCIESVGAQVGFAQSLLCDPALISIGLQPVGVSKDKITRAMPLLTRAEAGKILLTSAEWNATLIN